ncbi:MAG TPA: Uma2 family endonuclease [Tepidisphaeraceae bacterium]|jgi:Uma2 family endonuclease|nr:Uma2 family endonuclease [Tepidisphaeraceae bacterium]
MPSIATQIVTARELWKNPPPGRCELIRGEIVMMAPSGFDHGATIINLSFLLAAHVKKHKLGVVVGAETGFIVARDPDTVRGADIAFVRADRLLGPRPKSFWIGAPDLAVEVLSPDDRPGEVARKVDDYLAAGALLVWVVSPKRKSITVHQPMAEPRTLRSTDTLDGGIVLSGFRCKVAQAFE